MSEVITAVFLTLGVVWIFLAATGLLKFKDFFYKVHIVTKGPSLGILFILIGLSARFGDPTTIIKCLTIAAFVFITVPIGSSLLALAEYENSEEASPKTQEN
jgi:multicomponent Na+:H+ antiporter subunit G